MTGEELAALDAAIERALDTGDHRGIDVLGYGEISSVVRSGDVACKRLPLFDSQARVQAYRRNFELYLKRLEELGVEPVDSRLRVLDRPDGRIAVYCMQPVLPAEQLGPAVLDAVGTDAAHDLFEAILDRVCNAVGERFGLDAQLSNWVVTDGGLRYLDVTTPMMRDENGAELLDVELFLASLPWAMRGAVRRYVLRGILEKYYDARGGIVDFLGNLVKEGLDRFLPGFIEQANQRFERPISSKEVGGYYRSDKRTWAGLQWLRRVDRAWQRRIRRRQYPFLLPGRIAR
jgi:hypothetical protein